MSARAGASGQRLAVLLRGINVGTAKRVAMADLRATLAKCGYRNVATLLNSGNAVCTAPPTLRGDHASRIEKAIAADLGVQSRTLVLTLDQLESIVTENPLADAVTTPSRFLVHVLARPADRAGLEPLARQDWSPGALAVGTLAAYAWCPDGVLESPLTKVLGRALGEFTTSRNWATMTKLLALARQEP